MHHAYKLDQLYKLNADLDFRPFGTLKLGTQFRVSGLDAESNIIDLVPLVPLKELDQMEQTLCLVPGTTTELEERLELTGPS